MAARETDIIMDFIVQNKDLYETNKEINNTVMYAKQAGKEANKMSNYYSQGYGEWRMKQKLLTAESRAMMHEMKYGWMQNSKDYGRLLNDQVKARYGFYTLAKAGKMYAGTTQDMMKETYALGKALKTVKDEMIKNNVRMRQSFFEQAGMMANMTTQAQRISENYSRMKNPIYMVNKGHLALANTLNKVANNGNAANIALRTLGKGANTKQLNDMVMMINQGIMRTGWIALGAAVSVYVLYGALHKLSMGNKEYESAWNRMVKAILTAMQPMISVFQTIAIALFGFITRVANLISKFNEAHPTMAKFIQGIILLAPLLTLILSPLAIGIGLFGGFQAALAAAWMYIGPVVTGLAAMTGTVWLVAAALIGLPLLFNHLMKTNQGFADAMGATADFIKEKWNQLTTFLSPVISTIGNKLSEMASKVKEAFGQIMSGDFSSLITLAKSILPSIIGALVGGIPGLIIAGSRFIPAIMEGMQGGSADIASKITTIFTQITTFLQTNLPIFISTGLQIVQSIIQGILTYAPQFVMAIFNLIQMIVPIILQLLPVLLQAGLTIIQSLVMGIITALPVLMQGFLQLLLGVVTMITTFLPILIQMGVQLVMFLVQGLVQMLPTIIQTAMTLVNMLLNTIITLAPQLIMAGIQLIIQLVTGILNMLPQIIAAAAKMVVTIVTTILTHLPQILAAGVQIIVMLVKGIISMISAVMGAARTIGQNLISAFKSINLADVGRNIMQGLLNGITSMAGAIASTARKIASSVKDTIKGALNIHSPSREMFALGEYTGQGFDNGMIEMIPKIDRTAMQLAQAPMDTVANNTPGSTVNTTNTSSSSNVTFAPQITVQGGGDGSGDGGNVYNQVKQGIESTYGDLINILGIGGIG